MPEKLLPKLEATDSGVEGELNPAVEKNMSSIVSELQREGALPSGEFSPDSVATQIGKSLPRKGEGAFARINEALKKHPRFLAVITALELMVADANFALAKDRGLVHTETEGTLPPIREKLNAPDVKFGDNYAEIVDAKSSFIFRHNLAMPKSFGEALKMFIEPIDFVVSLPYQKEGGFMDDMLIRFLCENKADKEKHNFKIIVDFPYKYSKDFDTAEPENKEQMMREIIANGENLFKSLEAVVGPLSFFEERIKEQHGKLNLGKSESGDAGMLPIKIDKLAVRGYASPESEGIINGDDLQNEELSVLRAQNAAQIIREIFEYNNFSVDSIGFEGKGEIPLTEEEKKQLLETGGYKVEFDKYGYVKDEKLLQLIKDYNDKKLSPGELLSQMEKIVGTKRKVEVEAEAKEGRGLIVLPIPLFLLVIDEIYRRLKERRRRRRRREAEESARNANAEGEQAL